tara:strand:+ start:3097 stop:3294 length:198 start_codon:yes stop_codon:yes gene_type:complete
MANFLFHIGKEYANPYKGNNVRKGKIKPAELYIEKLSLNMTINKLLVSMIAISQKRIFHFHIYLS